MFYFWRIAGSVCIAWVLGGAMACSEPSEGPGKATANYLQALQDRNASKVFALLDPTDRDRLTALHANLLAIRTFSTKYFSEAEQKAIWKKVGVTDLDTQSSPAVLFERLMQEAGAKSELSTFQRWGARIRSVDQGSASASVHTFGNQVVSLREVAGKWVVRLEDKDRKRLDDLVVDASRIFEQLKATIRQMESQHRYGGSTPGS